jgi:hypothetical protein
MLFVQHMVIEQEEFATEYSGLHTGVKKTFSLLLGPAYVYSIAKVFAWATNTPVSRCIILAFCGSTALIGILLCLSYQLQRERVTKTRYGLSTLLLVMSGLAVFFAPIGVMYRVLVSEANDALGGIPYMFFMYAIVFVPFSTMILVYFIDSLLWFALKVQRVVLSRTANK